MIEVLGKEKTLAQIAAFTAASLAMAEAVEEHTKSEVGEAARGLVPVETGETQASIEETDEGVEASSAAIYLEFGTYKMAAEPFMRPAADSVNESEIATFAKGSF